MIKSIVILVVIALLLVGSLAMAAQFNNAGLYMVLLVTALLAVSFDNANRAYTR